MIRELNQREKEFLSLLYFKKNYQFFFPNTSESAWNGRKENIFLNKLDLPIVYNNDCFGDAITMQNVSILTKRNLIKGQKRRFESGYGAVATYYSLTESGEEIAKLYFDEIVSNFNQEQKSIIENMKKI